MLLFVMVKVHHCFDILRVVCTKEGSWWQELVVHCHVVRTRVATLVGIQVVEDDSMVSGRLVVWLFLLVDVAY